jgi:peptidoglycan/xylan/chitin deacetylase (PgdA/CDA1 family)
MYHRITDDLPPSDLIMPVARFEEQISFLANHTDKYRVVSLSEIRKNVGRRTWDLGRKIVQARKCERPSRAAADVLAAQQRTSHVNIAITLDDGYRDNYLNAYPILKKYNLPASIFLTAGMIGTNETFKRYASNQLPDMLSWEEVKEMADHGITFGAHTFSHPHLPALTPDWQEREIQDSLKLLNKMVPEHARLNIFCYPYGEYDKTTQDILRELKVDFALTVQPGFNGPDIPPLELRRVMISGLIDLDEFELKLTANS